MRPIPSQVASAAFLGALVAAAANAQETNAAAPPPPPHWYQQVTSEVTLRHLTPVEYFRGLLGMTPAQRERALAGKSDQDRKLVLAKVAEYEAMPREAREQRLTQTELSWQLLELLRLDPARRKIRIREISPLYLPMILAQLDQWDQLPAPMRQALVENESFLRAYVRWQDESPPWPKGAPKPPAERRVPWPNELAWWQSQPEAQRAELITQFRRFFHLTDREQKETIRALSETERRQMEQALQSYAGLPPAQRRQCVESFSKFAAMPPDQQNQFLHNAEKWESMTPRERQLWRRLVNELPPVPPGFNRPPTPPMPPGWALPPPASAAAKPSATTLAQSTNDAR